MIPQLDPRGKLLGVLAFAVITAILADLRAVSLALVVGALMAACSGIEWRRLLRQLGVVNVFIVFLWLFLPFTIPGEPLAQLGSLTVTDQGVHHALLITLRANAIVLFVLALMACTTLEEIVHALYGLHVPDKLVYLLYLTYRYAREFEDEYQRLRDAMRIRGFEPRTNVHTYRSYAYLVGMLLVNGYERGQRLQAAMLCRGFDGRFPLSEALAFRRCDGVALALSAAVCVALVVINAC